MQCFAISNQHLVDIVICNIVFIVHIVDIAMLYDIELTLCRHRYLLWPCLHRSHCRHVIESTSYRHRLPLISLFTFFTSSTLLCCTISNQNRIDIAYLQLFTSFTMPTSQLYTVSNQHHVKMILYEIYITIECFENVLTLIRYTNSSYISIISLKFISNHITRGWTMYFTNSSFDKHSWVKQHFFP